MPHKKKHSKPNPNSLRPETADAEVRIIGGTFRGRRLLYHGDPIVRPMKHRTRESMFNLISTECEGRHAIDLFAGTGALGLEALSRGAASATFIEKHVPSARIIEENIRALEVEDRAQLLVTSAFLWAKRDLPTESSGTVPILRSPRSKMGLSPSPRPIGASPGGWGRAEGEPPANTSEASKEATVLPHPWLVFCSPPYAFFHDRQQEMLDLIQRIKTAAPPGSILVVETDDQFDFEILRSQPAEATQSGAWDIRAYPPAIIAIWRKP